MVGADGSVGAIRDAAMDCGPRGAVEAAIAGQEDDGGFIVRVLVKLNHRVHRGMIMSAIEQAVNDARPIATFVRVVEWV